MLWEIAHNSGPPAGNPSRRSASRAV